MRPPGRLPALLRPPARPADPGCLRRPGAGHGTHAGEVGGTPAPGGLRAAAQIGQGGMGVVYEAEQHRSGGMLLSKCCRGGRRQPTYLERFRREAKAAGRCIIRTSCRSSVSARTVTQLLRHAVHRRREPRQGGGPIAESARPVEHAGPTARSDYYHGVARLGAPGGRRAGLCPPPGDSSTATSSPPTCCWTRDRVDHRLRSGQGRGPTT